MKRRGWIIYVIGLGYLLSPLWSFIKFKLMYNIPFFTKAVLLSTYGKHYILMSILTMLAGYGVWKVHKWGFYLVILHSIVTIINNSYLYINHYTNEKLAMVLVFNLGLLAIVFLFLRKEIYSPYFNPRLRWWEQAKRFLANFKIELREFDKEDLLLEGKTFDISTTGIFIAIDNLDIVDINKHYSVRLAIDKNIFVVLKAIPMWKNSGSSKAVPKGIGFKFIDTDKNDIKIINSYTKKLNLEERKR